jgi:hypothetical protein
MVHDQNLRQNLTKSKRAGRKEPKKTIYAHKPWLNSAAASSRPTSAKLALMNKPFGSPAALPRIRNKTIPALDPQVAVDEKPVTAVDTLSELKQAWISPTRRRRLILCLEELELEPHCYAVGMELLKSYIRAFRDTADPSERTAVASAVRTYVSELPPDQLGELVQFLDHRSSVPHVAIELEIAKMIVRKLIACPRPTADSEPSLSALLLEMIKTYMVPRQIKRKWYAATCIQAAVALFLLRSPECAKSIELVRQADSWVREMIIDELDNCEAELSKIALPQNYLHDLRNIRAELAIAS